VLDFIEAKPGQNRAMASDPLTGKKKPRYKDSNRIPAFVFKALSAKPKPKKKKKK
jgi:hypothetical protein